MLTASCGRIIGSGTQTIITSVNAGDITQATLKLTASCELSDITVNNTSTNASGSTAILEAPSGASATYVYRNVVSDGGADTIYDIGGKELHESYYDCDLTGRWDLHNVQTSNSSSTFYRHGGTWHSTATIVGHAYGFVIRASGQTGDFEGGSITIDSGSVNAASVALSNAGTTTVRGGLKLSTASGAVDLENFGTLTASEDVKGSGINGKPTSSGTITNQNIQIASINGQTVSIGGAITTANAFTTSGNFAVTLTATATSNTTLPAGTKTLLATDGSGASLSNVVNSITGTSNQVVASGSTGAVTLSLPQSIATSSTPQFGRLGLGLAADSTATLIAKQDGIAATSTDGWILENTTTATSGVPQQWSPRIRLSGTARKSAAGGASHVDDWTIENETVNGSSTTSSILAFASQVNGGGYTSQMTLTSAGNMVIGGSLTTGSSITANSVAGISANNQADLANGILWDHGVNQSVYWDSRQLGDATGTVVASWSAATFNLASGAAYKINSTSVLNATTLGSGITASSLTSFGSSPTFVTPILGTPTSGTLANCSGLPVSGITASTSTALGVGSIELGHASDTTLSRSSGGVLAVEGVVVPTISSTNTLTNKRNTPRITTITSSATPTVNTDNCDAVTITALATAITSMTTNLSGTPNNFDRLIVRLKDDGSVRAITWGASFKSSAATLPTTTVASKVTTVGLLWDSVQSKWICLATDQEP